MSYNKDNKVLYMVVEPDPTDELKIPKILYIGESEEHMLSSYISNKLDGVPVIVFKNEDMTSFDSIWKS